MNQKYTAVDTWTVLISQRTGQTAFHKALARSFDGTQANAQGGGNLLVGLPLRCGK